ncbi:MAG: hypothetical protein JKY32_13100 [Rhizobiales bacterium]|nr:hypothetical protein [Hyphomicrobiales bacterium]
MTQIDLDRQTKPAILLLGNYRPALAMSRALHESGYSVILGLEGEELGAECSRFVTEIWDHPSIEGGSLNFLSALEALFLQRPRIVAVVPVSEEFMLFLEPIQDEISRMVAFASPSSEIIRLFSNKLKALKFAGENGVPTLPYACVTSYDQLGQESERIGFPVVLRPFGANARILDKKALIYNSPLELQSALPAWPEGHGKILIQRFASGHRHNLYFAAYKGKMIGSLQTRIRLTNSPDGTGLAVDGVTVATDLVVLESTKTLIRLTNYTGVGLSQFIIDPVNKDICFLELNPRISGSHAVPELTGLPLTQLAVEMAIARHTKREPILPDPVPVTTPGLRYVWTSGEILAAKQAFVSGDTGARQTAHRIFTAVWAAMRADIHMIGIWRDPLPALLALFTIIPGFRLSRAKLKNFFISRRLVETNISPKNSPDPGNIFFKSKTISSSRGELT